MTMLQYLRDLRLDNRSTDLGLPQDQIPEASSRSY